MFHGLKSAAGSPSSRRSSSSEQKERLSAFVELSNVITLINAIKENDQTKIDQFLKSNSSTATSPTSKKDSDLLKKEYHSSRFGNLLHLVAAFGSKSFFTHLLSLNIPHNLQDGDGNTPLHKAAISGKSEIIDILLKLDDIDDNVRNVAGKTALECCKSKDCIQIFETNRKNFISSRLKFIFSRVTPQLFDLDGIKNIWAIPRCKALIDINSQDASSGETLLHLAVMGGNVPAVTWLLEQGADPFSKNRKGKLPVEVAKDEKMKGLLKDAPMTRSHSFPIGSNNANLRIEGYLNKWTNYASGFKRRWFVLENGILSYYKSQADYPVSCRGSIHLRVAKVIADLADRNKFEVDGPSSISYHLRADSKDDAKRWIVTLTEVKKWIDESNPGPTIKVPGINHSPSIYSSYDREGEHASNAHLNLSGLMNYEGGNNGTSGIDSSPGAVNALIKGTLLQLDLNEQLLSSFHDYLSGQGSIPESVKRMFDEYVQGSSSIFNSVRATLNVCEEREAFWKNRLECESERGNNMEETAKYLARENNARQSLQYSPLEKRSGRKSNAAEEGAKLEEGNEEEQQSEENDEDDEFFDAEEVEESNSVVLMSKSPEENGSSAGIKLAFRGYGESHRSRLPTRDKQPNEVSVWSILRNALGADLSRLSIPINFNEPLSLLQRLCEDVEYSQLLDIANSKEDSLERIQYVAAFAASSYASTDGRTGKPFNPLLGETFEFVSKDRGFRYISEQVSHHPPISACYCESNSFIFWSEVFVKSTISPTTASLDIRPLGTCHVILKATDEHFSWKKVVTSVRNIITGKLWMDHKGPLNVTNHSKNETCCLNFKETGWTTKEPKLVDGVVKDSQGKDLFRIKGKWNDRLVSQSISKDESAPAKPTLLWKRSPLPEDAARNFNFGSFTVQLNDLTPELKPCLCPTDCRLREDQRLLEMGEYDRASDLKNELEKKQRKTRKEREGNPGAEEYSPRWFYRDVEEDTNENHWVFKGGYWESRESGKWENVPDIYVTEEQVIQLQESEKSSKK